MKAVDIPVTWERMPDEAAAPPEVLIKSFKACLLS